ncbi:hypothetical protein [Erythrobacter longus]|nr:hypothetical protein [Erythrobacter longus]
MRGPEIPVTIRPEAPGDEETIHALTEAAFKEMPSGKVAFAHGFGG